MPSEILDNMLSWISEFFNNGHSLEYLDDMNHWNFMDIISRLSKQRNETQQRASGKTVFKNMNPSQLKMIENRRKLEKEGKI